MNFELFHKDDQAALDKLCLLVGIKLIGQEREKFLKDARRITLLMDEMIARVKLLDIDLIKQSIDNDDVDFSPLRDSNFVENVDDMFSSSPFKIAGMICVPPISSWNEP